MRSGYWLPATTSCWFTTLIFNEKGGFFFLSVLLTLWHQAVTAERRYGEKKSLRKWLFWLKTTKLWLIPIIPSSSFRTLSQHRTRSTDSGRKEQNLLIFFGILKLALFVWTQSDHNHNLIYLRFFLFNFLRQIASVWQLTFSRVSRVKTGLFPHDLSPSAFCMLMNHPPKDLWSCEL